MIQTKFDKVNLRWSVRQIVFWLWLSLVTAVVLIYSTPQEYDVGVGDVVSQDIRAPRDITFVSDILSQQAREDAARRVQPLYTAPDSDIARGQYNRARDVLAYLRALRADPVGSEKRRSAWVRAVPELSDLSESDVEMILTMSDAGWNRVQLEFLGLLDQVMRQEEVREENLVSIRRRIPAMVSLDMPQEEAVVIQELVKRFVRPNVFFDEVATEMERDAAREAVGPAFRFLRSGQIIVREGTVVSELDIEALTELGLTAEPQASHNLGNVALLAGVSVLLLGLFLWQLAPDALDGGRQELLFTLILSVFLGLIWLLLRSGDLVPFLYPVTAAGMLLATTVGSLPALGGITLLSLVAGWAGARSLMISTMVLFGGFYATLTLPRYEQTGPIFRAGLIGGIAQAIAIFVFSIDELRLDPLSLLLKLGVSVVSGGIGGGLTVGGLFLLTPLFDLTTTFRLIELSRPNHPLLQRLLREAPATFNHVMMVTSLAEQAAERIGANSLLTRVGAYYHDIGKLVRPYFFAENQQDLSNPHERLDAYTSADVLVGHIRDGQKLAREYHLPAAVRAFINEHHGTMKAGFFYGKAVEAVGGDADLVDESQFRYPGPSPRSRETLLVMLADGCEAATRARRPTTPEELREGVDMIFEQRIKQGQLDECPITFAELKVVKETYIGLLRGAFHPRVKYPEPKSQAPAGSEESVMDLQEVGNQYAEVDESSTSD
jgi:cyclic-di-AMP phosphodiesterase PgpH